MASTHLRESLCRELRYCFDQASVCRLRINVSGIVQSGTCCTEPLSTNKQIRIDSLEASGCLGEKVFCKDYAEPAKRNGKRKQQD